MKDDYWFSQPGKWCLTHFLERNCTRNSYLYPVTPYNIIFYVFDRKFQGNMTFWWKFQKFKFKSKMDKSDKQPDKKDNLETSLDWIPVDSDEECIPRWCVFTSFLFEELIFWWVRKSEISLFLARKSLLTRFFKNYPFLFSSFHFTDSWFIIVLLLSSAQDSFCLKPNKWGNPEILSSWHWKVFRQDSWKTILFLFASFQFTNSWFIIVLQYLLHT